MMRRTLPLGLLLSLALIIGFAFTPSPTQAAVAAAVQVVNPDNAAGSVPTHDAGPIAPVHGVCAGTPPNGYQYTWCNLYTVPAGKRLVVEMFSYYVISNDSSAIPYSIQIGENQYDWLPSDNQLHFSPVGPIPTGVVGIDYMWQDTRAIRLYFDEHQIVEAAALFSRPMNGQFQFNFRFSGYLVNK
jgi:hypothetical protein